ncbi:C-C chemokine receptor type 9 isoform 1-T2 [Sarcophilus harrisii]
MIPTDFMTRFDYNFTVSDYYNYSDNDNYNDFCEKTDARRLARYLLPPFYWLMFVVGTLGNNLVIIMYWYCTRVKTMTDVFLLNLAIADLLFLLTLPFWADQASDQWKFGTVMCKMINATQEMNFYSSMLFITCISVDRCIVIAHAWKAHLWRQKSLLYSKMVCCAVWVIAITLCIPEYLYSQDIEQFDTMVCTMVYPRENDKLKSVLLILKLILRFFLPLIIIFICYTIVIHTLLQTKKSSKHKALKVIILVLTLFVLTQFPYNSNMMLQIIDSLKKFISDCDIFTQTGIRFQVTQTIAFSRSCQNPYIYVFVGKKFRQDLVKTLRKLGCISQSQWVSFTRRDGSLRLSSMMQETSSGPLSF